MIDNEVIVHIFRTGVPAVIQCIESALSLFHSILVSRILLYVHRNTTVCDFGCENNPSVQTLTSKSARQSAHIIRRLGPPMCAAQINSSVAQMLHFYECRANFHCLYFCRKNKMSWISGAQMYYYECRAIEVRLERDHFDIECF